MKNELDRLRDMLSDAGIPFQQYIEFWPPDFPFIPPMECPADVYRRNQIIYGGMRGGMWRFSAILQWGSYGRRHGLLETYGELGSNERGNPRILTAEQAFEIVKCDYDKRR